VRPTIKEILEELKRTRDYLMWGTVPKAYTMLDALQTVTYALAEYVQRLEARIERLEPRE